MSVSLEANFLHSTGFRLWLQSNRGAVLHDNLLSILFDDYCDNLAPLDQRSLARQELYSIEAFCDCCPMLSLLSFCNRSPAVMPDCAQTFLHSQWVRKLTYLLKLINAYHDTLSFLTGNMFGQVQDFLRRVCGWCNTQREWNVRIRLWAEWNLRNKSSHEFPGILCVRRCKDNAFSQ